MVSVLERVDCKRLIASTTFQFLSPKRVLPMSIIFVLMLINSSILLVFVI